MNKDEAIKEIKQLKELLDTGILTQEEYDKKSSELKKIILDSQDEKNELSKSEKEDWEQKAKEKSNTKKERIPLKKEESKPNKKVEIQEKVVLKETTIDSSKNNDLNEYKNDERNTILITEKEQTNCFLSIALIFPSLILFRVREKSWGDSMNYAIENFFYCLIMCVIISLIIFGIRSSISKGQVSYFTTFYKTTYTICVILPLLFYIGYFFGYVGRFF